MRSLCSHHWGLPEAAKLFGRICRDIPTARVACAKLMICANLCVRNKKLLQFRDTNLKAGRELYTNMGAALAIATLSCSGAVVPVQCKGLSPLQVPGCQVPHAGNGS